MAEANNLVLPLVTARLTRTAATAAGAAGRTDTAEAGLARSAVAFTEVLPQTRPVAETDLLQAAELARQGQTDRALALCKAGTDLLRELRSGTDPALLAPCLAAYADRGGAPARRTRRRCWRRCSRPPSWRRTA